MPRGDAKSPLRPGGGGGKGRLTHAAVKAAFIQRRRHRLIRTLQSEVNRSRMKNSKPPPPPPPPPAVFQAHNLVEVRSSQPRPVHDKPSGKVSFYNVPRGTGGGGGEKKGEQIMCSSPVSSCPSHSLSSAEIRESRGLGGGVMGGAAMQEKRGQ